MISLPCAVKRARNLIRVASLQAVAVDMMRPWPQGGHGEVRVLLCEARLVGHYTPCKGLIRSHKRSDVTPAHLICLNMLEGGFFASSWDTLSGKGRMALVRRSGEVCRNPRHARMQEGRVSSVCSNQHGLPWAGVRGTDDHGDQDLVDLLKEDDMILEELH